MGENKKTFSNFTNLYELSKTLRFELKPIGETQELLKENQIIELDKVKKESYEAIKPYFNTLHIDFINQSLKEPNMGQTFQKYFEIYEIWSKDKKNKSLIKNKETEEKNLRIKIETFFDTGAEKYLENYPDIVFKKKDKDFLYEIWIFELMKEKFKDDENIEITDPETWEIITIFDIWNGWLGYFTKFFNTRKNFYKSDGTSTAISTRIINDNLKIFVDNMMIYENIKYKLSFDDIEADFGIKVEEIFKLDFYNSCFLQDGIDMYNKILWWETLENGKKLRGLNEYINKKRQDTGEKIPFFKKLQKQILSEKQGSFIEQIEGENDFFEVLKKFYADSNTRVTYLENIFKDLETKNDENYKKIYFNKIAWNTLSHKFTSNVLQFEKIVFEELVKEKLLQKKDFNTKEQKYKFPDFIPLYYIKKALDTYTSDDLFWKERYYISDENQVGFLGRNSWNLWEEFCQILNFEFQNILSRNILTETGESIEVWYTIAKEKLWEYISGEKQKLNDDVRGIVKDFADNAKILYSFGKYFALEKSRDWDNNFDLDDEFYKGENWYLENFYTDAYDEIIKPYNLMRNYITKKPWSDTKKWKINFENSSLLWGWDKNFESNGAYIFRKNEKYYLWIINGTKPKEAEIEKLYTQWWEKIERFVYDFQKPDNKNIPRTFIRSKWESFAPAVEKYNLPIQDILEIYDNGLFKTENKWNPNYKNSLIKMIDYFKLWLSKHESYKHYNFVWKESSNYENIAEFYRDAEKSCYKPKWESLNYNEILQLVEDKKLYLFQIYNKDFELDESLQSDEYSFKWNGQKNTHTLYFESLFQTENIENTNGVVMKLSGWWEVFFRPKAIEIKKEKRNFNREITANKRYTEMKMFLHFPMQLNFKEDIWGSFNEKINTFLAYNPDINIIWVDRGEKHLAYFSVINQKSEILESGTLNHIENFDSDGNAILESEKKLVEKRDEEGNVIEYILEETWKEVPYTDYALLLEVKEKNRKLQRQSWKEVEQIKDLKKGYISAVIKKLADLIIQHNAIVVFEDLNMRFKQIRGWIEKSVYQQLEKALIDKLNFLVDKNEINPEKAWNLLKAYQLTAPVEAFKDMGKQTWILFYTQVSYTSQIDPVTGWRPNLYLKKQNAQKNKENILKFDAITFNLEKQRFEFTYDVKKFIVSEKAEFPDKTKWIVCSSVERFRWNRNLNNNKWWYDHYPDMTDNFKKLFGDYNIDISWNIVEQIGKLEEKWNEKFFSDFIFYFGLVCQIRNTNKNELWDENDFILSPVEPFFDTRKSIDFWNFYPKNGDDNGAFNIARKGLVILQRISDWSDQEKEKYPDLFISKKDWDNFTQDNKK